MQTESTARLSPGVYRVADRRSYHIAPDGAVRSVRPSGKPSRYVVARLAGPGLKPTGNGQGHEAALHALATGQAIQVEVHCADCGRTITDPDSVAAGRGPQCRQQAVVAGVVA